MAVGIIEWKCKICGECSTEPHNNPNLPRFITLSGLCRNHSIKTKTYQKFQEQKERQAREKEAQKIRSQHEYNQKTRCVQCSHYFGHNEEWFYYNNNPNLKYCVNCSQQEDKKRKNITNQAQEFVQQVDNLMSEPELKSWEFETNQGETIPDEWQESIVQKKNQVDQKEKTVQELKKTCQDIMYNCRNCGFYDWVNNEGKEIENYLKETGQWLAKLYVNCWTKNWEIERNKKENSNKSEQENLEEQLSEKNGEYDNWHEPMAKIEAGEEVNLNQWNLPPRQRQYLENMQKNKMSANDQEKEVLLAEKKKECSSSNSITDRSKAYVGCGIIGLFALLLILILMKNRKGKNI